MTAVNGRGKEGGEKSVREKGKKKSVLYREKGKTKKKKRVSSET